MNDLNTLTNANTIERYSRDIKFTKDVLLLEIQQSIKAAEFENSILIGEFTAKFYGATTDSIMIIKKRMIKYQAEIKSSISLFEDALNIENEITTYTNKLSVLLQTTYDEVSDLINDIDTQIEYLTNKIK